MKQIFKKFILPVSILCCVDAVAQNTIPTTTCTGAMKINDSLSVNKDIMALGDITSKGEMVATDTMRAMENVIASKDIKVDGSVYIGDKLNVAGTSVFEQEVTTKKGLLFNNQDGISYSVNNGIKLFNYGARGGTRPQGRSCAAGPQPWANHQFGGMLQIYDADATGQYVPNSGLLNFQTWSGGSSIDASIGGVAGNGNLLLNYFCHNNTLINCGGDLINNVDGGIVFMGAKVSMQNSLRIGGTQNSNVDLTNAVEINPNSNTVNGVLISNALPTVKAYAINRSDGKNTFVVYGDGRTQIGADRVTTGPHTDAMLTVGGTGKVACKEVRVFNNTSGYWADFVFEKNYKLMPLLELENYYKSNKHLPNIPTAKQIEKNGNDLAKTDALLLQKIEELTLYLVQQQKEIEALKKEIRK